MNIRFALLGSGLLTATLLLATPAAHAQLSTDLITETYNSNISVITDGAINKATLKDMTERDGMSSAGRRAGASARLAASTTYTPTVALRQQTVQNYVNRLKTSNPASSQRVASSFGPGKDDYNKTYRDLTKESGLRENDVVDVMATYLIIGWMIVNNVQDGNAISVPMARGVRAQVAPLAAGSAKIRTHAAQVGEELKLQTVVVQSGWQSAIKAGTLAAYQQSIGNLFKTQYGMDLKQFKLADTGLVNR